MERKQARMEQAATDRRLGLETMKLPKRIIGIPEASAATSGSPEFEDVFAQHWTSIYRLLVRMVGDPSEAEDLALETFYRLYRRPDRRQPDFNSSGWLHRVAINLGLHSIRAFRRRLAHEIDAGRHSIDEVPDDSPVHTITERDEHTQARIVLAGMNPRQSQLLLMRHSGASYMEIAETLHLSATSIGPLLLRAEREFSRRYRELSREDA